MRRQSLLQVTGKFLRRGRRNEGKQNKEMRRVGGEEKREGIRREEEEREEKRREEKRREEKRKEGKGRERREEKRREEKKSY